MTVSIDGNGNPGPCSDGSRGYNGIGYSVTLHNNVIDNWVSLNWPVSEPKPAPNSQKVTWDVPWGTTGKTITILMECLSINRASVYYTYTYQEQEVSAPASQSPITGIDSEKQPLNVKLVVYPEKTTDVDVIEIEADVSGDYKTPLNYVWYKDNVKLEGETGYKIRLESGVLPGEYLIKVQVTDDEGRTGEAWTTLNVVKGDTGIRGDVLEANLFDPIPNAIVSATSLKSGDTKTVKVSPDGKYSIHLMPGNYKVSASAPGYLTESGTFGDDVKVLSPHDEPYCIDCYTTFNFRLVMEPTNGGKAEISTNSFEFAGWGAYRFADISGKRYFAAYLEEPTQKMLDAGESIPFLWQKSDNRDLQKNRQLSEVLMDDNNERTLTSGEPLKLEEGYELAIKSIDIDGRKVYLELSKDDAVVDSKVISPSKEGATTADRTYCYKSNVGRTEKIVQIAVYFETAFRGSEQNKAIIGGLFQISDSPMDSAAPQTGAGSISGPSTATDLINKGYALDSQGKYDEAIQAYDEAIEIDPQYVGAWINKGSALYSQGKYDEAVQAFDEAIEINPQFAEVWYNKGSALHAQGKYDDAIKAFDETIRLNPDYAEAWYRKGTVLHLQEKYDEAIQANDEAIRLNPDYAEAWNNKGDALIVQSKYDEAIKAYDEAIRLNHDYAEAWNSKGTILYLQDKYDEAIKAYDEAIRLDPNHAFAWNYKGNALKALGRDTEANAAFAKAKELGYKG